MFHDSSFFFGLDIMIPKIEASCRTRFINYITFHLPQGGGANPFFRFFMEHLRVLGSTTFVWLHTV